MMRLNGRPGYASLIIHLCQHGIRHLVEHGWLSWIFRSDRGRKHSARCQSAKNLNFCLVTDRRTSSSIRMSCTEVYSPGIDLRRLFSLVGDKDAILDG